MTPLLKRWQFLFVTYLSSKRLALLRVRLSMSHAWILDSSRPPILANPKFQFFQGPDWILGTSLTHLSNRPYSCPQPIDITKDFEDVINQLTVNGRSMSRSHQEHVAFLWVNGPTKCIRGNLWIKYLLKISSSK